MDECRILLVRHPETTANVEGRYVGRGDTPLSERGATQVPLLVSAIEGFRPDAIYTSPLMRARIVAEGAASALGMQALVDERLTELDFGVTEGLTYPEIVERGITFSFAAEDEPVAPGGESRRDILRRTAGVMDDIVALGGKRVAVVTHGGVVRSALVHLLGLPISAIWSFEISNGCVAHVRVIQGHGQLVELRTPLAYRIVRWTPVVPLLNREALPMPGRYHAAYDVIDSTGFEVTSA